MKTLPKYIVLSLLTLIVSCKDESDKPKVKYENSTVNKEVVVTKDTTQVIIADLPIQLEGTSILIHPVGEFTVSEGVSKYRGSSKETFNVSNTSENEIAGFMTNVKFQASGSDSLKVLTDKSILIERITFLKSVSEKIKQNILVYALSDNDTNKDGKLDSNDINTLYLSDITGEKFTKIAPELQEVIDWNVIESKNRLYFRTIEDNNKNGKFDKNDILHYYFIDLNSKDWKVQDYKPV